MSMILSVLLHMLYLSLIVKACWVRRNIRRKNANSAEPSDTNLFFRIVFSVAIAVTGLIMLIEWIWPYIYTE